MEFFKRAKVVRLRSQHHKFLTASEDEETVKQSRNGSSKNARWTVEPVEGKPNVVRLKSCFSWKYLSASEEPFLLGWTGKRVFQSSPRLRLDPAVEWEPIKQGAHVKLRTRKGTFLRGNGGVPPWNNSVTVDVPSRSVTQDWIIWTVDVLEIDHELTDDIIIEEKKDIVEESLGSNNNIEVVDHGTLSRKSSYSSVTGGSTTMEESNEDIDEVESNFAATPKSVRSVRSSNYFEAATPSPRASPTASEKSTRVSPLVQNVYNETQHSNSFNKLKSMLNGLQDLLDDTEQVNRQTHPDDSETSAEVTPHHPHQLEVKMAKQTLKEMKDMDFETFLSSGRDKKLEKSINILIADAKFSSKGQVSEELASLQDQVKSMRNDRALAIQDLSEFNVFSSRRLEIKAELKKDASKAHELETLEVGFTNMLTTAKAKREALLKQLEEIENSINAAERAQSDNAVEIEELISRIGDKSQSLRDMERNEKSWQAKKIDAERMLDSVEEEWVKVKDVLQDI